MNSVPPEASHLQTAGSGSTVMDWQARDKGPMVDQHFGGEVVTTMSPLPAAKMSHARHSSLRVQPMEIGRTVLGLDRVAASP